MDSFLREATVLKSVNFVKASGKFIMIIIDIFTLK